MAQLIAIPGEPSRLSPLDDDYEPPPTFLGLRQYEIDRRRNAIRVVSGKEADDEVSIVG